MKMTMTHWLVMKIRQVLRQINLWHIKFVIMIMTTFYEKMVKVFGLSTEEIKNKMVISGSFMLISYSLLNPEIYVIIDTNSMFFYTKHMNFILLFTNLLCYLLIFLLN